jgi:predicted GIY-YIG superfamily endonuclease
MDYKFHIVYKTTNLVNGKIYVGVHSTNDLNDGYLGSGWALKAALKKYGRESFARDILYIFSTRKLAMDKEAEVVDEHFVTDKSTYNLVLGGGSYIVRCGKDNPAYGKVACNAKRLLATHKSGKTLVAESIEHLSAMIHIARGNIRNLIKKNIQGKRGWKVELLD